MSLTVKERFQQTLIWTLLKDQETKVINRGWQVSLFMFSGSRSFSLFGCNRPLLNQPSGMFNLVCHSGMADFCFQLSIFSSMSLKLDNNIHFPDDFLLCFYSVSLYFVAVTFLFLKKTFFFYSTKHFPYLSLLGFYCSLLLLTWIFFTTFFFFFNFSCTCQFQF